MKKIKEKIIKTKTIKWLDEPEEHDYPAAKDYLELFYTSSQASNYVTLLRIASIREFKAKDILRASQLSPLGMRNSHVEKNTKKIMAEEPLSPILLVKDNHELIVADGYHRLCAIYEFNEDIIIKCKLV